LGVDVSEIDPTNFDERELFNADLLVLRSIDRLNKDQKKVIHRAIFEKFIPYVTYQHDYSFCKERNSIRCNGVLSREHCVNCTCSNEKYALGQVAYYANLLSKSRLNIFISHPQRHIFGEALGAAIDPSIVILPPVDP